ncbi:MAG: hypothetical protein HY738_22340, partial [Bacteroidia bacterium]|nr:hypothetical protein [Bacteroidia bacterium]
MKTKVLSLIWLTMTYNVVAPQKIFDVLKTNQSFSQKMAAITANNYEIYYNSDSAEQKRFMRWEYFSSPRLDENECLKSYQVAMYNLYMDPKS